MEPGDSLIIKGEEAIKAAINKIKGGGYFVGDITLNGLQLKKTSIRIEPGAAFGLALVNGDNKTELIFTEKLIKEGIRNGNTERQNETDPGEGFNSYPGK